MEFKTTERRALRTASQSNLCADKGADRAAGVAIRRYKKKEPNKVRFLLKFESKTQPRGLN
jgi:hypothetical protein